MSVQFLHSDRKCSFVSILFWVRPVKVVLSVFFFYLPIWIVFLEPYSIAFNFVVVFEFPDGWYILPFLSVSIPVWHRRCWTTKLQLFLGEVMKSSKLFKEFSRIHPGIQHFSPNSSRNCYCWVNMLTCKLIITCGRHVSGFWKLESELHSHNLLISSDKWSTHHVGLHTVTQHSFTYSPRAALLFFLSLILLFSCVSAVTLLVNFLALFLFNYISK